MRLIPPIIQSVRSQNRRVGRPGLQGLEGRVSSRGVERNRGFTLIELMVVIVLIGIMTAMIIPEMRGSYQDAVLRSASRKLVDGFDLAYSRAISFNQTHRVRLDRKGNRYVIEKKLREGAADDRFVPLKDVSGSTGALDSSLKIGFRMGGEETSALAGPEQPASSGARDLRAPPRAEGFTFYPDGTSDAGEVVLEDREGFRVAMRMNPVTARVHIIERPPK